jgi:hypothetical protein
MRTSRCILYTALGTVMCLLYVFEQTEIVKLGYKITSAQKVLQASLDRKTMLEYTFSSLESPQNLDKNLFLKNDGFEMAQKYKLVKVGVGSRNPLMLAKAKLTLRETKELSWKRLALQTLFGGKQAEAKTIK